MKSLQIINKIESKKVELGMNVELGLLQDAMKMTTSADNSLKSANQKVNIIIAKQNEAVASLGVASQDNQKALNLVNTLIKNTKDLGLPISVESQKMFEKLTARAKEIQAGIATLKAVKVVQVKG
jgi:exonuclease VII small subunit